MIMGEEAELRHFVDVPDPPDPPSVDGPILKALRKDLASMPASKFGARETAEAQALWLAAVADRLGVDGSAAMVARVSQELSRTLVLLTKGDDDDPDSLRKLIDRLSAPVPTEVRDAPDT